MFVHAKLRKWAFQHSNTEKIMSIECSICFEKYQEEGEKCPKLLPCSHTLCLQCLEQLVNQGGRRLQCPECRENHQLPAGGVRAFNTNRYILEALAKEKKHESILNAVIDDVTQQVHGRTFPP